MKLLYVVSLVATDSLPHLLGIALPAAYLVLAGCSTHEAATPKAAVNSSIQWSPVGQPSDFVEP